MTKGVYGGKQRKKAKRHKTEALPKALDHSHQPDLNTEDSDSREHRAHNEVEPPMKHPNRRDRVLAWTDTWNSVLQVIVPSAFSLLLLIVIIVQAVIYWKQAKIMDKGLGAAESSAKAADQSAKLAVQATRPYVNLSVEVVSLEADKQIVRFRFMNEGNTPASITYKYGMTFGDKLPTANCPVFNFSSTVTVLPHKEKAPIGGPYVPLTNDRLGDIVHGRTRWCVCGEASYDGVGGPYPMPPFCFVYRPDVSPPNFGECSDLDKPENLNNPNKRQENQ